MRLSDAYEHVEDPEDIVLDLKVQVININYGKNQSLMEKSPTLAQYAIFVDTVRKYEKDYEHMEAVELVKKSEKRVELRLALRRVKSVWLA